MRSSVEEQYARLFAKLNTNRNRKVWTEATAHQAPHKPLLLLSVLDLVELGEIYPSLVEITDDLIDLFGRYWHRVLPFSRTGNIALPFFHLRSEGFWNLLLAPGVGRVAGSRVSSIGKLREHVVGACLDEDLRRLLLSEESRERLRSILIGTYFSGESGRLVSEQSLINRGAFIYSRELLERPGESEVREGLLENEEYRPALKAAVRDQGFRRAVVRAYSHRCALCGVRVRTLDGHTAVDAAHIVPWSETRDDRPANGLGLCRMCHWTFDEGLLGVSRSYEVIASSELLVAGNLPGYLTSLEGRAIFLPSVDDHRPDTVALGWHEDNVLR